MYKTRIFYDGAVAEELQRFLNSRNIAPEDIVSISLASDANAYKRITCTSIDRILLVYWED